MIKYGQMSSTALSGVQILRIAFKDFILGLTTPAKIIVVESTRTSSTTPWTLDISGTLLEYGTDSSFFDISPEIMPIPYLYFDICYNSAGGAGPSNIYKQDFSVIDTDTQGRTFFTSPNTYATVGYKMRDYDSAGVWQDSYIGTTRIDLYKSGWYQSPSLDAYNADPSSAVLVQRIMVGA